MKRLIKRALSCLLACILMLMPLSGLALTKSTNPLLGGLETGNYTKTKDNIVNILLLGIDYGYEYSDYISCKTDFNECHTDAIVVVSLNKTQKTVDLVSIPRDTLSYVPGVKGIYKANAAVNCADTVKEGVEKTRGMVSFHLGGIEIHHYVAVDVPAMIALGDAIGGVEYDLEMSYTATSGYYQKGLQVLNGQGIMDYVRARKNAPIGGTDLGRTERQRKMLSAIFQKLKAQPSLVMNCLRVFFRDDVNILTDIGFFDAAGLAASALSLDLTSIETHVLDGKLQDFYSNFNFTDQEARRKMLMEVYGIEVEDTPFVSNRHTRWLINEGFEAAKCINLVQQVLESVPKALLKTAEVKAVYEEIEQVYNQTVTAFDAAALTQNGDDRSALLKAQRTLKSLIEKNAEALGYTETLRFKTNDTWYKDSFINEFQFNWN